MSDQLVLVRNRFSERIPVVVDFRGDPGRTRQAHRDECDINKLMARYLKTGQIDHFAAYGPQYGDFSPLELQEALNTVNQAQTMFADLPSDVRKRFGNDPGEFLSFVQDTKNLEEMRKLGLAKPAAPAPDVQKPSAPNGSPPSSPT